MSAPWRIVDCSTMSGALHSVRGGITIEPQGEPPVRLPLADVAVLLVGPGVALGPSVMQRLARHDVTLLPLDWRAIPVGALAPWVDHGRVGARHLAQSRMSLPRRKNAWARLVRSKILGQAEVLRVLGRRRSGDLREIARSVRSGDPHNAEAQAARAYWASLFPEDFVRDPGARRDLRNSSLDYGYSVLRGHGIRAVAAAGLSPTIGLFHRGRANYFNLVDDLIEPFRPVVDYTVAVQPPGFTLDDRATRQALVKATSTVFAHQNTVVTELTDLAQALGRYVEGDLASLSVPSWSGPAEITDVPF